MPLGDGLVFYRTCEEASPTQVTGIASGPGENYRSLRTIHRAVKTSSVTDLYLQMRTSNQFERKTEKVLPIKQIFNLCF